MMEDEDGYPYFMEAIKDGFIEYEDFFDAYLVAYYIPKKFLFWRYGISRGDILKYCPYCGEKIYEEPEE